MLKDLPITEARDALTSLPDQLSASHDAIAVTRRGKPVLAILTWEEYEALVETLEILGDSAFMARLRQGIKELKHNRGVTLAAAGQRAELREMDAKQQLYRG